MGQFLAFEKDNHIKSRLFSLAFYKEACNKSTLNPVIKPFRASRRKCRPSSQTYDDNTAYNFIPHRYGICGVTQRERRQNQPYTNEQVDPAWPSYLLFALHCLRCRKNYHQQAAYYVVP